MQRARSENAGSADRAAVAQVGDPGVVGAEQVAGRDVVEAERERLPGLASATSTVLLQSE